MSSLPQQDLRGYLSLCRDPISEKTGISRDIFEVLVVDQAVDFSRANESLQRDIGIFTLFCRFLCIYLCIKGIQNKSSVFATYCEISWLLYELGFSLVCVKVETRVCKQCGHVTSYK